MTATNSISNTVTVVLRWLLGAYFIYMGLNKALDPEHFLKLVRQYDLVRTPILLNSIAAALPWFEIFCGILLLTGIAVRGAALMVMVMLGAFTPVVLMHALAISSAKNLAFCAVKFDCGCGAGEVFICHKLIENSLLFLASAWLLAGRGRQFSLRYSVFAELTAGPLTPPAREAEV
jgi:uncharacterized membrane protein YphA (DoxX/SURF4 family)